MNPSPTITETFFLEFEGEAFDGHRIPAAALAQSLLALDALARSAAEAAYGRGSSAEMSVRAGLKPGVFVIDLVIRDPARAAAAA